MEPEKVAILVDGGFYQRRAKALWGDRTAKDRADELEAYCRDHLHFRTSGRDEYDSLYRIFYYDCPPAYLGSVPETNGINGFGDFLFPNSTDKTSQKRFFQVK